VKYDSSGNRNWIKIYSAGFDSRANAMAVDIAGNIYVVGHGNLTGKFNYLTIKYSPQGDTLWTAVYLSPYTYGGSDATAICTDLQCNVYVTGMSINQTTSGDYITVKYNINGVQQWVTKYDFNNNGDGANGITVDKFGFCYVTGGGYLESNRMFIGTIKYSPSGDSVWTRILITPYSRTYEYGKNIILDSSLNVYVTGLGSDSLLKTGFKTIKYDKNGNALWISFDTNYVEQAYSSVMDKYGKIYSTGSTSHYIYSNEFNSLGVRIWGAHYPQSVLPSEHYSGIKLFIDNYDKLYLFGSSLDSSILIKYGSTTNINKTPGIVSKSFKLFQNYPNPFNPSTNIRYQISKDKFVSLKVYDVLGREIETLVNEKNKAGTYEVNFNGEYLPTGVYFYSIFVDGMMLEAKKMLLIK
jgi:hypothetical protein